MSDKPTCNEQLRIVCETCGWKSELYRNKDIAFEAAQDHQDIEHGGSTIEWKYVH